MSNFTGIFTNDFIQDAPLFFDGTSPIKLMVETINEEYIKLEFVRDDNRICSMNLRKN
jgi:hypothetical protein